MVDVKDDRDLQVVFKPFSLAVKNGLFNEDATYPHAPMARKTHGILRVMESVRKEYGDDAVSDLYTKVGTKIHIEDDKSTDWMSSLLEASNIDTRHLKAADDESFDADINASMEEAFEVCGTDIGTPVIRVDTETGARGFFGPVISTLPDHEEGLRLWDGIATMISFPDFYELKRTREVGPNVASTNTDQADACAL
jgi:hypothetical protein